MGGNFALGGPPRFPGAGAILIGASARPPGVEGVGGLGKKRRSLQKQPGAGGKVGWQSWEKRGPFGGSAVPKRGVVGQRTGRGPGRQG